MNRILRPLRPIIIALALLPLLAGPVSAGSEGRVLGSVVDTSGAPIEGVRILVTRPESNYKLEKTSDKKGQFTLLIVDATQKYEIRLEKEGFVAFQGPLQVVPEDMVRPRFTLAGSRAVEVPVEVAPNPKNDAVLVYNEAVAALQGGDLPGAAAKLQQALTLDPDLPEAHVALAEILLEQGKPAEALAAADRFLALRPGDRRGLRARYDALKGTGDAAKAAEALKALSAAEPGRDTAVRVFNEGAEASRAGRTDDALRLFLQAVEADATLAPAHLALASLYYTRGEFPQAAASAERLLALQPEGPEAARAHYILGLAHVNLDDKAKALEHLQAFLKMAPNDPDAAGAKEMVEYLKK